MTGCFLESTGDPVLDRFARGTFTFHANRADPVALKRFADPFNHWPKGYDTVDA